MANTASPTTIQVFKTGSKWAAHLYWNDGTHWSYWLDGFATKHALLQDVTALCDLADTTPHIVRGIDEGRI